MPKTSHPGGSRCSDRLHSWKPVGAAGEVSRLEDAEFLIVVLA